MNRRALSSEGAAAVVIVCVAVGLSLTGCSRQKNEGPSELEVLRSESIETSNQLLDLESRMKDLNGRAVSIQKSVQSLNEGFEHLQTEQRKLVQVTDDLNVRFENVLMPDALAPLQQQIKALETRLQEVDKRVTRTAEAAAKATKPASVPVAKPTPKKAPPVDDTPRQLTPPFTIVSPETRGSEIFLAILPKLPNGQYSLSQVRLLRVRDSYQNWTLTQLMPRKAVFMAEGRKHIINLP